MNKKLAKKKKKKEKKLIFLAFEFFANSWAALSLVGKEGGLENSSWKNMVHILCCVWSPSLSQLGPLWPGLVQLSPQHEEAAPRGSRCVADGGDGVLWGSSYVFIFFFVGLLVMFLQQHDCIISVHTWQNRARFPLKCPGTRIVFVLFTSSFFFFLSLFTLSTKMNLFWRCFRENQPQTEDGQLKSFQTGSLQIQDSASAASSLTLNITCVFLLYLLGHI